MVAPAGSFAPRPPALSQPSPPPSLSIHPQKTNNSPLQVAPTPRLPPSHPAWLVGGPLPSAPGSGGQGGDPLLPDRAWALLRAAPRGGAVLTAAPLAARLAGWGLAGLVS
jgi:hypothetical protein